MKQRTDISWYVIRYFRSTLGNLRTGKCVIRDDYKIVHTGENV